MRRTRFIAVGACAIDTILTVPHFPEEDSKLRATSFQRRRGGNCPNTLEVLQQLVAFDPEHQTGRDGTTRNDKKPAAVELFLVAALPAKASTSVEFISSSFLQYSKNSFALPMGNASTALTQNHAPVVNLSHCLYREDCNEPVSSYIVSSESTCSRTIINHNALPEMTFDELVEVCRDLLRPTKSEVVDQIWFHFEGRIPDVALECIRHLRYHSAFADNALELRISVELEKPGRPGLQNLAREADVVFYSSSWAKAEGYGSAQICLLEQANILQNGPGPENPLVRADKQTLICAWGAHGACATTLHYRSRHSPTTFLPKETDIIHSPAHISVDQPIVDATGAGDTFIAGVLFGMICRSPDATQNSNTEDLWSLKRILDFANGLAGRKILQHGFRIVTLPLRSEYDWA